MIRYLLALAVLLIPLTLHAVPKNTEITYSSPNEARLDFSKASWKGKVDYFEIRKNTGGDTWTLLQSSPITELSVTISGAGLYEVALINNRVVLWNKDLWVQRVYVPGDLPSETGHLAWQYMPIFSFHDEEEYLPMDLKEIFSFDKNKTVWAATGDKDSTKVPLKMGDEFIEFLRFNGHKESFAFMKAKDMDGANNSKRSGSHPVYWLGYHSVDDRVEALYITYFLFYGYDKKHIPTGQGSHAFDRESVTIRFVLQGNGTEAPDWVPDSVVYAGHLESQNLRFKGCNDISSCLKPGAVELAEWKHKTKVMWPHVARVGDRPLVYIARGSHAPYPSLGHYKIPLVTEPAGSVKGSNLLLPDDLTLKARSTYLQKLDLAGEHNFLTFSGYLVDVLGSTNAKFPPFIRTPVDTWFNATGKDFDTCVDNSGPCYPYIENVLGLTGMGEMTLRTLDSETKLPLIGSKVSIKLVDLDLSKPTTTDQRGQASFFYTDPKKGRLTIKASHSRYEEEVCMENYARLSETPPNGGTVFDCFLKKSTKLPPAPGGIPNEPGQDDDDGVSDTGSGSACRDNEWVKQDAGSSSYLKSITSNGGRIVAIAGRTILTSVDGVNWSDVTPADSITQFRDIVWAGNQFVILAAGSGSGKHFAFLTSTNGVNWSSEYYPDHFHTSLWSPVDIVWDGEKVVLVDSIGNIYSSANALTWDFETRVNTGVVSNGVSFPNRIVYAGNKHILVTQDGQIWTSNSAKEWTKSAYDGGGRLWDVAYGNGEYTIVGADIILSSGDGQSWEKRVVPSGASLRGVVWNGSQFVAVGLSGTILSSADGKVWESDNTGASGNLKGIVWTDSKYVAVGDRGVVLTSGSCSF